MKIYLDFSSDRFEFYEFHETQYDEEKGMYFVLNQEDYEYFKKLCESVDSLLDLIGDEALCYLEDNTYITEYNDYIRYAEDITEIRHLVGE